ncbi:MAG: ATP synthase F0 subunit B [Rubrivivax sp.]|nr:ATP synthase F0 subunit B [Rubrivivax sp.]
MKTRIIAGLIVGFCIVVCSALVSASETVKEAEHHAEHHEAAFGKAEIFQIINFLLLVILLVFLYKKYAGDGFEKRSQQIKMAIEEAEHARRMAEQKCNEYRLRVEALEKEIEDILARAKEEADKEHEQILQEARVQAAKIRSQAEMTTKQEVIAARQLLRDEAINLAADLALGLLKKSVTGDDHRRFVELYVRKMGEMN